MQDSFVDSLLGGAFGEQVIDYRGVFGDQTRRG
jgi:hypothetical protein